jgi:hypothetical protein
VVVGDVVEDPGRLRVAAGDLSHHAGEGVGGKWRPSGGELGAPDDQVSEVRAPPQTPIALPLPARQPPVDGVQEEAERDVSQVWRRPSQRSVQMEHREAVHRRPADDVGSLTSLLGELAG